MPSGTPDKKEQEPITDQQCVDAMKQGNFELVKDWYAEQEPIADQDPSGYGRIGLAVKLGGLQLMAGLVDYAFDTLQDAYEDAHRQGYTDAANKIRETIEGVVKELFG